MRRRKLLIGAGSLVASGAAVVGSGAFTSATAQRSVTVNVAGDGSAYLRLRPGNSSGGGPNAAYAEYNSDDELEVNLDGSASSGFSGTQGDGVNPDAVTDIDEVFTIYNQGTQDVGVYLTESSSAVTFYAQNSFPAGGSGGTAKAPSGTNDAGTPGNDSLEGQSNHVDMSPGSYLEVSIQVDTTGTSSTDLLDNITVHADASLV
ncbi:hypothetical protein [Haloplanus pelagicus]|uniref:hypothetical protein n=1 Tax=Haloplanus pelagicus TaxID=2949995 RepID=UPI00203BEE74|nr:hypothetical protein [Haloplanus sp. HW8-1]